MSGETVLELDGVTKVYGEQPPVAALRGVSFSVRRGELVAIVGPSGSGKSTLLHVMGTLERPSSGAVRIGGVDAARLSDRELSRLRAREIGFVFQQFFLAEHATVRENVADGLLYAGVPAAERYRRADEALERVGLSDRASFTPTKLSGGQRQRVAIARALVGRPAIVLADEPTGNLDSTTGASIMALIRELNAAGATIIMITHDAGLADQLPRQLRMLDGQVVSDTGRDRGVLVAPTDGAGGEGARRHERQGRTTRAEGRAAGGERRAARPAAARRAVRARDRDRNGRDRRRPRAVLLLAGRAARGDRPARHEPADRRSRTAPHRGCGAAPARSTGADHPPRQRPAGGPHRPGEGREGLPQLADPEGQLRWHPGAGRQPEPAVPAQHRRRTGRLAQRGHRPRAGRGAGRGRRPNGWASTASTRSCGSGWETSGSTSRAFCSPRRWRPTSTTAP